MIVIVDNKRSTGVGESLSGAKAFYINAALAEDWKAVESHPDFRHLDYAERMDVKSKFPVSAERYKVIWSTHFY